MVLVVVIALAWMVILGPGLMKRRSRSGDGISSISHFHHQLRVLEHSGAQPLVRPAYRLRGRPAPAGTDGGPWTRDPVPRPVLTVVGADRLPRPALAFLGADPVEDATGRPARRGPDPGVRLPDTGLGGPGPRVSDIGPAPGDPTARHLARRRRRATLGILAMFFVASGFLGFVPGAGRGLVGHSDLGRRPGGLRGPPGPPAPEGRGAGAQAALPRTPHHGRHGRGSRRGSGGPLVHGRALRPPVEPGGCRPLNPGADQR